MKTNWLNRLLLGLCFALPLALLAAVAAQAGAPEQAGTANDCAGCHEIIQSAWQTSAHSQALSDPAFHQQWKRQGRSPECLACHTTGYDPVRGTWEGDGVMCTVCHYPAPSSHPESIMPTDISSRLCGTCHINTYAEWQTSTHGQEELNCIRCHNPHTTDIRKVDAQALCRTCHSSQAHDFGETDHAVAGLLCTDCHLRVEEQQLGEGHGRRQHTFVVDLQTCASCHGGQMHQPGPVEGTVPAQTVQATFPVPGLPANVQAEPAPVSPIGYAVIAALVGMACGIVLAPWLENWSRRSRSE